MYIYIYIYMAIMTYKVSLCEAQQQTNLGDAVPSLAPEVVNKRLKQHYAPRTPQSLLNL